MPEIASDPPHEIRHIGVVGAGMMGVGIACSALIAGLQVSLVENAQETLKGAGDRIEVILDGAVTRGKMRAPELQSIWRNRLKLTMQLDDLADVDLVIEAVTEDIGAKQKMFAALDQICASRTLLATNTSYLNLGDIGANLDSDRAFLGLHFFAPAHVMKLLEVVVPEACAPETVAAAFAFAKRLGKQPVQSGPSEGFIGNRILQRCRMAADQMVLRGADPPQIDAALQAFGYPLGPYAAADLSGLEIGWGFRKRRAERQGKDPSEANFPDALCELGHLGRKTGCGYYCYNEAGRVLGPNPAVAALIAADRAERALPEQPFTANDIVERFLTAMVNEAATLLGEGVARSPFDVDVVLTTGFGFPQAEGGPMCWADRTGLDVLLSRIMTWSAQGDPTFLRPAPLLEDLVSSRRCFDDLNKRD